MTNFCSRGNYLRMILINLLNSLISNSNDINDPCNSLNTVSAQTSLRSSLPIKFVRKRLSISDSIKGPSGNAFTTCDFFLFVHSFYVVPSSLSLSKWGGRGRYFKTQHSFDDGVRENRSSIH